MRSLHRDVPSFSLYGEKDLPALERLVHVEDIPSRSSKYLWRIAVHRHLDLWQCVVVTDGPVTVNLEASELTFAGPTAIVVPASTIHGFRFRAQTRGYVLTVKLPNLLSTVNPADRPSIEALFAEPRAIDLAGHPALASRASHLLECLLREYRHPDRLAAPIAGWLACSVLWTVSQGNVLCECAKTPSGSDWEDVRRFRSLIDANYTRHWPLARYAKHMQRSAPALNRLCRRLTGSTGFDLIQQRLALEARRRLLYGGAPIGVVAGELGFKDSAYFARFFRRHSGVSPHEFRCTGGDRKVPMSNDTVQ